MPTLKGPARRLEITSAGYWYVGLTIMLGVAAVLSGNNVLLLLESLLLGGLILSGVLSEWALSSVDVVVTRGPAFAGEAARDVVWIRSRSLIPLFCIDYGEFSRNGHFVGQASVEALDSRSFVTLLARADYHQRGEHHWQATAIATAYPFGLARKIRFLDSGGSRLVWPRRKLGILSTANQHTQNRTHGSSDCSEGEIKEWDWSEDSRNIVWTKRLFNGGIAMRPRSAEQAAPRIHVDLRAEPGIAFENTVSMAAFLIAKSPEGSSVALELEGRAGTSKLQGRRKALDALAIVAAEGSIERAVKHA